MTGKMVSALSGGCLMLTSVVMLCFYIGHYIDTHSKMLGILKAMGYSAKRIAGNFAGFGLSVFTGTIIGYVGAHLIMPQFYRTQNADGLLPELYIHFHPSLLFSLVILPTLAFALLSVLYGYFRLKTPVLELLKGKAAAPVKTEKTIKTKKPVKTIITAKNAKAAKNEKTKPAPTFLQELKNPPCANANPWYFSSASRLFATPP